MLNLKKVAVTGGLASGKSTVCRIFAELGAYTVSADSIVHQLLSPELTSGKRIADLLGNDIISGGQIDRKKVADKVFKNPNLLKQLEEITHPLVFIEMQKNYQEANPINTYKLFVAEVPLLFESYEKNNWFDYSITIDAPTDLRQKRFLANQGTLEDYKRRSQRQLPDEEKLKRADFVIQNTGDIKALKAQILPIFQKLSR